MTLTARLHDGATIDLQVAGSGPTLLVPVNPVPAEGPRADELRQWGVDPALGRTLMDGLADVARVVAFDYEGHVQAVPKPGTLTPDNIVADLHAIADAAGADRFAYYGYSWLGLVGIQLAIRSPRLLALAVGGFPPLDGPYREMLEVTRATHREAVEAATTPAAAAAAATAAAQAAAEWNGDPADYDWSSAPVTLSPDQTRQFVTLYEALRDFDDRTVQDRITCPRVCFVGSRDDIDYPERWGNVRVGIAEAVIRNHDELERLGWAVHVLEGLDHTGAMQPPAVLPVIRPWLVEALASPAASGG
jgi:pimeloyl-ACP methyl ester carboxylesterase